MKIMNESYLKAKILCNGVTFTDKALQYAIDNNAKTQNLVYNAPIGSENIRPQELFIKHDDGYEVVASCVAPNGENSIIIDVQDNSLIGIVENSIVENISIEFVKEPKYYSKILSSGDIAKKYVSSCGYDELNILPWKGCAISKTCLFCGVNQIVKENKSDSFNAFDISNKEQWKEKKDVYLPQLKEAIINALDDECFKEHMHVIIISGDLSTNALDLQTQIYAEISSHIYELVGKISTEGIIAVMMPPKNLNLIDELYKNGVRKLVYNLEVGDPKLFNKYCPGKSELGYNHILTALEYAIKVFGKGNVWSNFVLGLEPIESILTINKVLLEKGIVPSANVLHLDKGNRLDCKVPTYEDVLKYFYELSSLLKNFGYKPYYCSKALRTSLSNEAYDGRFTK